jgi:hypothetical protein
MKICYGFSISLLEISKMLSNIDSDEDLLEEEDIDEETGYESLSDSDIIVAKMFLSDLQIDLLKINNKMPSNRKKIFFYYDQIIDSAFIGHILSESDSSYNEDIPGRLDFMCSFLPREGEIYEIEDTIKSIKFFKKFDYRLKIVVIDEQ